MAENIYNILHNNVYPGRGIIIGRSEDGGRSVIVYFIMGRSENSRNRVFVKTDGGIRTEAYDPAKLTDPSLVIYSPVHTCFDGRTIVTNGDQTDTIFDYFREGHDFRTALLSRTFEPDPPIYTPRISGLLQIDGSYKLSILKSMDGNPECCCRQFFEYSRPIPGVGHFISTYKCDGNPPPSFTGEPVPVGITMGYDLEAFAQGIWDSLNPENRVALYAHEREIANGDTWRVIINRHLGGVYNERAEA